MKLAAALLLICTVAHAQVSWTILPERPSGHQVTAVDAYDYAPYIELESPLYRAILDPNARTCVWIQFIVRGEDVEADNETDRGWWRPVELAPHCLESDDYVASNLDRGHLRSIQMSRGSAHWRDVNCLAVIVPETPELNRGAISQLESDICDLAELHGWCRVTIHLSGDAGNMPRADEPHAIPERLLYVVESPAGVREVTFENGGP